jgi:hypothetical protein
MEKASKKARAKKETTIKVSEDTKEELKEKKRALGLRSLDEVIQSLLGRASVAAGAVGNAQVGAGAGSEEIDDDGKTPLPQRLFAADLVKNAEAVQYHTGLRRGAYLWFQKEMVAAVRVFAFLRNGACKCQLQF